MSRRTHEKIINGRTFALESICCIAIIVLSVVLSIVIYKCTNIKSILNDDVNLISISAGLVTVITFVCNFLNSKASSSREDYYLGRNIKLIRYYQDRCLRIFNYSPIKWLLWLVLVLAVVIEIHRIDFKNSCLKHIVESVQSFDVALRSVWASAFIVVSFLGVMVLIGSIDLTKKVFSYNATYSLSTENEEKNAVRRILKNRYSAFFRRYFNALSILRETVENTKETTGILYEEARDNTLGNQKEFDEYLRIIYRCENNSIKQRLKRIDNLPLFKCRCLKKINNYYLGKWSWFAEHYDGELITLPILYYIAYNDLKNQIVIFEKFHSDEYFFSVFMPWRIMESIPKYRTNNTLDIISDLLNGTVSNIGKNVDVNSHVVIRNLECFRQLDNILSQISDVNSGYYFRYLDSLINCISDSNVSNSDIKRISNNIYKGKYRDDAIERSMKILFGFNGLSTKKIGNLIEPFDENRFVATLLFILAYRKRSGIKIITVDEFEMWKRKLFKLIGYSECAFSDEDIKCICNLLSTSPISHFANSKFISSVIKSLDYSMDDVIINKYYAAKAYYELDCYLILRLLLRHHEFFSYLSNEEKEKVHNEIHSIEAVLEAENVMCFFAVNGV